MLYAFVGRQLPDFLVESSPGLSSQFYTHKYFVIKRSFFEYFTAFLQLLYLLFYALTIFEDIKTLLHVFDPFLFDFFFTSHFSFLLIHAFLHFKFEQFNFLCRTFKLSLGRNFVLFSFREFIECMVIFGSFLVDVLFAVAATGIQ